MRTWAVIGTAILATVGCGERDEPLGCAELVVTCPEGAPEQQWWLAVPEDAKHMGAATRAQVQAGQCGQWLAFIRDGATDTFEDIDVGNRAGEMRLRVLVAADGMATKGGTLLLFADPESTADPVGTPIAQCKVGETGGWFNWLVVDCGPLALTGRHTLVFQFKSASEPPDPYVFNFAAFGIAYSGEPDCTVTGPKK